MKYKVIWVVSFIFAAWLGGVINSSVFSPNVGAIILSNDSSQMITSAQVAICGQTFSFSDIPKGEFAVALFDVTADSHYDISVSLQSGRIIGEEMGYVTHGFDYIDVIGVNDSEITLGNYSSTYK